MTEIREKRDFKYEEDYYKHLLELGIRCQGVLTMSGTRLNRPTQTWINLVYARLSIEGVLEIDQRGEYLINFTKLEEIISYHQRDKLRRDLRLQEARIIAVNNRIDRLINKIRQPDLKT